MSWIFRALLCCSTLSVSSILTGCGPKLVVQDVYESEDRNVAVKLRRELEDDSPLPRAYDHPATISDVRVAHILAHIVSKNADGATQPTIPSTHVYPLAEGISQALAKAGPDDEVLAITYSRERRFGIFTYDRATSFRVTLQEPMLNVDFFAIGELLEKDPKNAAQVRTYKIPDSLPDTAPKFELAPTKRQVARGRRGIAFEWRDKFYGQPVSLSLRGGRLKRRTILMEAEPEELAPETLDTEKASPVLRSAQLRALDRLDAARRAGEVSEADFQRRRRLILDGRVDDAGFDDLDE